MSTNLLPHETPEYFKFILQTTKIPDTDAGVQKLQGFLMISKEAQNNYKKLMIPKHIEGAMIRNVEFIVNKVCEVRGIDVHFFLSKKSRTARMFIPRELIVYFARKYTSIGWSMLARVLLSTTENFNHSTMINAYKSCCDDIQVKTEKFNFYPDYLKLKKFFEEEFTTIETI